MAGETTITVIGNLTNDPELRFTPSGSAVANFTVASTPRTFNRTSNEWEDGETLFLRAAVWREAAENVAQTLTKGMRVIVEGRLKSRSYETKEGEKRTVIELEVDEIGPSLRYATAQVQRTQNNGGQQQQGGGFGGQQAGGFGGGQQQAGGFPNQGGGFPGQAQQPQQQGGGFGGWGPQYGQPGQQPAAQQQPPAQQQQRPAQQYAQAAAAGPQAGAQQPYQQQAAVQQDDPWATPGVSNAGGWGNGPANEPPF